MNIIKETKLSIAHRLVLANPDKSLALSDIMNILGVSRSNAFVYYTKVTAKRVAFKVDKGEKKTVGKTTHSDTETVVKKPVNRRDTIRKALKINEIDAFISQLPKTPSFMPV